MPKGKPTKGRPTKFKKEYLQLAANYCSLGATDAQLAEFFNVTEQTINNWKKKHPTFFESLKDKKEVWDDQVEVALKDRAIGYWRTKEVLNKFGDIVQIREEMPPDTTACAMWLNNRRPEQWNRNQIEGRDKDLTITFKSSAAKEHDPDQIEAELADGSDD